MANSTQPVQPEAPNLPWPDRVPRPFGSLTAEKYVTERLNVVRAWYDKEATQCKRNYLLMRATTVIGGAVVPVLINMSLPFVKELTTLISLLVVVLLSLESVMHYREQWKSYRSTEQALEKEYYNFVAADGAYRGLNAADAFRAFVDRVEGAVAAENIGTLNVMTTVSEGAKPPAQAPAPSPVLLPPGPGASE